MPANSLPPLGPHSRIAALIPHFRCEQWLGECLESLLRQTRPLDAIFVIDDASGEPPTHIAQRYPSVTLLTATENVGPYRLVQQVIDDTDFDGYLFQDADDWSAPDRLERLLLTAAETGAELLASDYLLVETRHWQAQRKVFPLDANSALRERPTGHAMQHPASLVARTLVERLGGYASGMRFSGDDEFLRRAAHVTRVVNLPRVMYFRRHRAESLTTAKETGHGSPARRAVLHELAERAHANAALVAQGQAPDLSPLRVRGPVELEHLCGPQTFTAPDPARQVEVPHRAAVDSAANVLRSAPVLVLGAPGSGADVVAWALGQHHRLEAAGDLSWLVPMAAALQSALATAGDPSVIVPDTRPGTQLDALAAGHAEMRAALTAGLSQVWAPVAGDAPAPGDDDLHGQLRRLARRPLGTSHRLVGTVPVTLENIDAVLDLFPDARVVHVVRDVDEAVAALCAAEPDLSVAQAARRWRSATQTLLRMEQRVGASQVLRVGLTELAHDVDDAMRRCLAFVGEEPDEACCWAFRPTPQPLHTVARDSGIDDPIRLLSAALAGPPLQPVTLPDPAVVAPADTPPPAATRVAADAPAAAKASRPKKKRSATPGGWSHPSVPQTLQLANATVPAGARVAVVSKGDDDLLHGLAHATGLHLPQTDDGKYAGHHPADSAAAIDAVETVRSRGAEYLLIPHTSLWWLEHYEDLRTYLQARYSVVVNDPTAGVIYDVRAEPDSRPDAPDAPDAVAATPPAVTGRAKLKVSVIAWNLTHNPYGRAHLLAEMLADVHDVELVGATFDHFGQGIWAPLRDNTRVPVRSFEGGPFPDHFWRMEEMARSLDADVLYVAKPRMPSLGLGVLAKLHRNRPLVLDVDDRELTFVNAPAGLDLDGVRRHDAEALSKPYGSVWTRYCDTLAHEADSLTVSNPALQDVFGGTIIPHARDESLFDPARFDRRAVRQRLGFGDDDRVILFAGTPRRHKGIREIAAALRQLGDARLKLCLIATDELREMRADLDEFSPWIHTVPYQPMSELPALLAAADLTCVLQDPSSAVSQFQIPAKITDAMAMGVPCLVAPVPPLSGLIEAGLLEVTDRPLAECIAAIFDDYPAARQRAAAAREHFLDHLSYRAVRPVLRRVLEEHVANPPPPPPELERLVRVQREAFALPVSDEAPDAVQPAAPARRPTSGAVPAQFDVVLFWKQNDTGIYGRRHDMLLAQLVASTRVRRIVQFDHPISVRALEHFAEDEPPSHGSLILAESIRRMSGLSDGRRVFGHTFVYDEDETSGPFPPRSAYLDFVRERLEQHGIGAGGVPRAFWVYPKNFDFPMIAEALQPDLVVADVVDDHRSWRTRSEDRDAITRHYAEIVGTADVVLTNCEPMQRAMREMAPDVHLVPNGCEYPPTPRSGPVPPLLRSLPRPIIGYVGNLSSRLDVPLLEKVAQSLPHASLVFVGSAHAGRDVMRLGGYPNVVFTGPRRHEVAKDYIAAFDVAIIPHLDDDMTRNMNPLKAFVYCAEGVPVVSTDIANLGELEELVTVAYDPDDFITKVQAAIDGGRQPFDAHTDRILRRSSWSTRMTQIMKVLDQAWGRA